MTQSRRVLVAGAVAAAGLAYLVLTGVSATAVYYLTVSELLRLEPAALERPIRVSGRVVDGTLRHDGRAGLVSFLLTDGTATVPVSYRGVKPDLLGYSAEGAYQDVVVEGRMDRASGLRATALIVKHGPDFEAAPTNARLAGTGP